MQSLSGRSDLTKALGDISSIRQQMARATEFRGYGPLTLALTGVLALLAALAQAVWLPYPEIHPVRYLSIWLATAILSAALIGTEMYERTCRIHSGMADEMIHMAVEQFLPCAGAGALLTLVIVRYAPDEVWMLAGLWQIVYALGVFSACRFLPRKIVSAGAWYLLTGLVCIAFASTRGLSPWAMAVPFGIGQSLIAAILFRASKEAGDEN
jgi:hypothetical protein